LSPPGRKGMLYFAPGTAAELLTDVDVPIVFTEGEFKTPALSRLAWHGRSDAAEGPGFLPIGIPGVWNWRGNIEKTYDADGVRVSVKGPIADLGRIGWPRRRVVILYDADVGKKPDVACAR
jgi:Domain of unknown function (DUF3854)